VKTIFLTVTDEWYAAIKECMDAYNITELGALVQGYMAYTAIHVEDNLIETMRLKKLIETFEEKLAKEKAG
jgi:hypothetical protein